MILKAHKEQAAYAAEAGGLRLTDLGPQLLAEDAEHLLIVMEDLGDAPNLADLLLGGDAERARAALIEWAIDVRAARRADRGARERAGAGVRAVGHRGHGEAAGPPQGARHRGAAGAGRRPRRGHRPGPRPVPGLLAGRHLPRQQSADARRAAADRLRGRGIPLGLSGRLLQPDAVRELLVCVPAAEELLEGSGARLSRRGGEGLSGVGRRPDLAPRGAAGVGRLCGRDDAVADAGRRGGGPADEPEAGSDRQRAAGAALPVGGHGGRIGARGGAARRRGGLPGAADADGGLARAGSAAPIRRSAPERSATDRTAPSPDSSTDRAPTAPRTASSTAPRPNQPATWYSVAAR